MESSGPAIARAVAGPLQLLVWGQDRPPPPARRPRWIKFRPYAIPLGLLLFVSLGFAAASYLQSTRHMNALIAAMLGAGSVLPVALTFRWPLLAWRIALVMEVLGALGRRPTEAWPWNPVQIIALVVVLAMVGFTQRSAVTYLATAASIAPIFVFAGGTNPYGPAVLYVIVALLADLIARRRQSRRVIAEKEELTALERARREVLEERARIAREMHDVVAHHMSMIAVQAETAPYRVPELPDPAREELATIAQSARSALADMRRLLGVLRAETEETPRTPQPGLGDVPELVETARRAGMPVTLVMPETDGVPAGVGLTAYRIVQEALANAARHAPGGPVRIAGRVNHERLELAIRNGPAVPGRMPPPLPPDGLGHGVAGMQERAVLLGGTLQAARDENGGYTVTAVLPLAGGAGRTE